MSERAFEPRSTAYHDLKVAACSPLPRAKPCATRVGRFCSAHRCGRARSPDRAGSRCESPEQILDRALAPRTTAYHDSKVAPCSLRQATRCRHGQIWQRALLRTRARPGASRRALRVPRIDVGGGTCAALNDLPRLRRKSQPACRGLASSNRATRTVPRPMLSAKSRRSAQRIPEIGA